MGLSFVCPICKAALKRTDTKESASINTITKETALKLSDRVIVQKSMICINGHAFDVAKEGYVNLLVDSKKKSKEPGDSKEMIVARSAFLSKGHYQKLALKIASLIDLKNDTCPKILDAGCGEGFYSDVILNSLESHKNAELTAIDMSREGVKRTAKKNTRIQTAVASVFDIPVADAYFDIVYSVFAPVAEIEFKRVLKADGALIIVRPGAYHLYELKKMLYEEVYLNEEDKFQFESFQLMKKNEVEFKFKLKGSLEILELIKMTPYYWKTPQESLAKIRDSFNESEMTASFVVSVFSAGK